MWSERIIRLVAGAAAVLVAAPACPSAAQSARPYCEGGVGIALVDVPSSTQDDPRARTYIVDHVPPGALVTRRIRVCNGGARALQVSLYPGAAEVRNGSFRALEGRVDNELSRWISVAPASVSVPAGGEVLAEVTIAVPAWAGGGERYAAVLAEQPAVNQSSGFSVATRVGVRVYLSVGGPRAPESDFIIDSLQASRRADGTSVVTAEVRNTGARALDLRGELALTDGPGGLSGGPFPAQLGTTLAPGQTAPVTVPLDSAIRGGPWTATLTLRSGLLERQARAQITFPDEAGAQAAPVAAENLSPAEDPKILVPIAVSLILLIALLLLWWLIARRRTRRKEDEEQEPVPAG